VPNVLEAGIDEAGRGPVIGPLVVACVVLDERGVKVLRGTVRDSKKLSPRARERLYGLILRVAAEVRVRVVEPREVDRATEELERGLNELEAMVAAELINSLSSAVRRVYVDSPDPLPERYADLVRRFLARDVEVLASNRAEDLYPHVAAASIVAKVERDRRVEQLRRLYGDFGSGYPSDPRTRSYLLSLVESGKPLPPIVRRSWRTVRELLRHANGC